MAEPPKNGVQKVVFLTKFDFNYYVLEASGALYCIQIFSRIILSKVFDNNYLVFRVFKTDYVVTTYLHI